MQNIPMDSPWTFVHTLQKVKRSFFWLEWWWRDEDDAFLFFALLFVVLFSSSWDDADDSDRDAVSMHPMKSDSWLLVSSCMDDELLDGYETDMETDRQSWFYYTSKRVRHPR